MIFFLSSGKMIFLFPENIIFFFKRKMEDSLSKKNTWKIWHILQMFQKDGLFKKIALEHNAISFFQKYDISFTDGN